MMNKIRFGGVVVAGIVMIVVAGLYSPAFVASAWSQLNIPGYPGPDSAMVTATPLSDARANDGYPGPGGDPVRPTSEPPNVRLDLEEDGATLLDFFEEKPEFQNAFGGIYVEHATGSEDKSASDKLVLQLVRDYEKANAIPALLPSLRYPERLRIEWVDYPGAWLEHEYKAISRAAAQHPEIQAVAIDGKNNRVEVLIAPSDAWRTSEGAVDKASLPADLAKLVADPSTIVHEGKIEAEPLAVRGGESWSDTSGGSNCTLGFEIKYNNIDSMLTAGHCISALGLSAGDPIYHNTSQIGTYSGVAMTGPLTRM